ncbi:MAG: thioesterase family protein [Anaerolineaceae bacterium]|nr:thioesterase family protein [Anaerolineaceae bacterium]MCB9099335.1 thioesterase family protein [Anaerolineales bacterium]
MPRVKLEEQPTYEFSHTVTVRVTDLNYGNHLGNDSVVGLISEARVNLLHALGLSEFDLGDGQTGIILADLVINFKAEGFLFDVLHIDCHIGDISRKSFRIFYRLTKNTQLVALAETGIITFNYADRQTVSVPDAFLQAWNDYKSS